MLCERCQQELTPNRSRDQNAWMHAAFKGWADYLGYSVDELKREMLECVFGTKEVISPITGEVRMVLVEPHTSRLTVTQFTDYMDRSIIEAAKTHYVIEDPEQFRARKRGRAA